MWRNGAHRAFAPYRTVRQFGGPVRSETSALNPQLEALDSSIQTPIKAGTHFTDPEGMEGWVDPLLSLGFEPATTGTRKESPAP